MPTLKLRKPGEAKPMCTLDSLFGGSKGTPMTPFDKMGSKKSMMPQKTPKKKMDKGMSY